MRNSLPRIQGFTLIELLAVVALMAVVAVAAVMSYEDVDNQAQADVTRYEMVELRKALLQFRRDTGVFPCGVHNEPDRAYAIDVDAFLAAMTVADKPAVSDPAATKSGWCERNALGMLAAFPFDETDVATYTGAVADAHPIWDPDTRRGWHGPYLPADGLQDAWGSPYLLVDPELDFSHPISYCSTATPYVCRRPGDPDYVVTTHVLDGNLARLVSAGPDRIYGGVNATDRCQPNAASQNGKDDLVLCLLK